MVINSSRRRIRNRFRLIRTNIRIVGSCDRVRIRNRIRSHRIRIIGCHRCSGISSCWWVLLLILSYYCYYHYSQS